MMRPKGSIFYWLAKVLCLGAAYFTAGKILLKLTGYHTYGIPVWPSAGIALAGILIFGYRVWPGILLGAFFVNIWSSFGFTETLYSLKTIFLSTCFAAGAVLQALTGVFLIKCYVGFPISPGKLRDLLEMMIIGAPVSCLVGASIGVSVLFLAGIIQSKSLMSSWLLWWLATSTGTMVFIPLVASFRKGYVKEAALVAVPVCLVCVITVLLFINLNTKEFNKEQLLFEKQSKQFAYSLDIELQSYITAFHATKGLFKASEKVERKEFHKFAKAILARNYGIKALEWAPRIPNAQRTAYEENARQEGYPDFKITELNLECQAIPAGQRYEYFPVYYLEPFDGNERALGFDLVSNPSRLAAMTIARDTDRAIATQRVTLLHGTEHEFGIILLLPVYDNERPHATLEDRRDNLEGYIVGVLRFGDMINSEIKAFKTENIIVMLQDDTGPPGETLLYTSLGKAAKDQLKSYIEHYNSAAIKWKTTFNFGERPWTLWFYPSIKYITEQRDWDAWAFLIGGFLFVSMLGVFLFVVTGINLITRQVVHEKTINLQAALNKAEESDRLKSAFLACMSHELRTPLNSIIGFTGILIKGLPGPLNGEQSKQLKMVRSSANLLLNLINDILDLSKIEAGQMEIVLEPFDLPQVIEKVVQTIMPLAEDKGLSLIAKTVPEAGLLVSDQRRVEQILINLLNNAVKFTEKGEVHINCEVSEHWLMVHVKDTGIGINHEDMDKIFDAFRQIDTGLARRYEGTGLGLSICKKLAGLLGAEISARSDGAGRGSVFTLSLPLNKG